MFEYMGYASAIWRISFEADGEDVVFIVSCDVEVFRPSSIMLQMKRLQLKLRDILEAFQCEAMVFFPRLKHSILFMKIELLGMVSQCSQPSPSGKGPKFPASIQGKYWRLNSTATRAP